MKIITTAVIKGGTGKTTTAAALAQCAADQGKKVLAIDLDPQANFTAMLSGRQDGASLKALHGAPNINLKEIIQTTPQKIDLLAGDPDLTAEKTTAGSISRLKEALDPVKRSYDLIIIDTPPQMGELVFNALMASTGLIIPLEADLNSLKGLMQITGIAEQIRQKNTRLKVLGAVLTRYDGRSNINKHIKGVIESSGAKVIGTIRPGIAIKEAQSLQRSLYDYARRSKPAQDYLALYNKIMED